MSAGSGPTELLSDLDYKTALPRAPFSELHSKVIDRPIEEVWPACVSVTAKEVRTLGPLMMLRDVPKLFGRAPYWALIRLPSGLIRRSWLAAIERRLARQAMSR